MSDMDKSIMKFNELFNRLNNEDKDLVSSNLYKKTRSIDKEIKLASKYPNLSHYARKRIGA